MRKNRCATALLIGILFLCGCGAREPVIYAPDAQICAGEEYDDLDGVAALDEIDGDLTQQVRLVRGDLDTDRPGRARLTYEVTNSRGFTARASRTIPYISKVSGVSMVDIAARVMVGEKLKDIGCGTGLHPAPPYCAARARRWSARRWLRQGAKSDSLCQKIAEIVTYYFLANAIGDG